MILKESARGRIDVCIEPRHALKKRLDGDNNTSYRNSSNTTTLSSNFALILSLGYVPSNECDTVFDGCVGLCRINLCNCKTYNFSYVNQNVRTKKG